MNFPFDRRLELVSFPLKSANTTPDNLFAGLGHDVLLGCAIRAVQRT